MKADDTTKEEQVIFTAVGNRREQMRRVAVDLRGHTDQRIFVRLVDESQGPWGHLNFDDFRFHRKRPKTTEPATGEPTPVVVVPLVVARPA